MKRLGRPSKLDALAERKILRSVRRGMPLIHAANVAGMSFQTLSSHRSKNTKFADALLKAIAEGVEARLKVIEQATKSADESVRLRSATWWLEHVLPEHFARSRIQVEAVGQVEHSFIIPQQTLNEIAEARARHEQRQIEPNTAA